MTLAKPGRPVTSEHRADESPIGEENFFEKLFESLIIRYLLLLNVVSIKQHSKNGKARSRSCLCVDSIPSLININTPPPLSVKLKC